ncbi:N-acetylmuramoyl-L-alanine amidase family protein [Sporosarcina sp. A2]|uniref:N-acetylmuramoyl-L-alanine amidase family protein n=1 Tax=Sporosarcina sp. A2 TaxID=3393449 RepID=UPI003D7B5C1C
MVKIALDAGHGINTAGKRTPDGEREWSFNNKVLLACSARLATYDNVQILRLDDPTGSTDVALKTRTDKANAWAANVLVSIHHNANAGVWGSHGGTETYVDPTASAASKAIAAIVHPRIVTAMGLRDRGVKVKDLHMTRESRMPAILTEGGFMDSSTDIGALRSDAKLKAQGEAIAEGIASYFGLKGGASTSSKPVSVAPQKEETKLYKPTASAIVNSTATVLKRLEQKEDKPLDLQWREKLLKGELTESDAIGLVFVAIDRGHIVGKAE